jgi:hypothetical protein
MKKAGGTGMLLTSAMIVAGIRLWMQVRGKTKTPFNEWAVGWGATFFFLALLSEVSPQAAGGLSLVVAFSDFLVNGVSLTSDLSSLTVGAEHTPILVPTPFAPTASTGQNTGKAKHA